MALLAVQEIAAGANPLDMVSATAGGDTVPAGERTVLVFNNPTGGSLTFTVVAPGVTNLGGAAPDRAVVVAAGATRWFGPLRPDWFASPTTGLVSITYSAGGLTVIARRFPAPTV